MFHTGATIPGTFPHMQGGGDQARYMTFDSMDEVEARQAELTAIVRAWVAMKS